MNTKRSRWVYLLACLVLAAFTAGMGCISPSPEMSNENITAPISPIPSPPGQESVLELKGVTWELVAFDSGRIAQESVTPGSTISARFEEGDILHGSSGCNQYSARYESTDTRLLISTPLHTRKTCHSPAGVEYQEKAYLIDLEKVRTYTIDRGLLRLMDGENRVVLLFREGKVPSDATQISWKTWYLASYRDDSGTIIKPPNDMVMITRFLDGTISGFAGCNCYQGHYQEDGGAMAIGETVVTDINCRNETVMRVEEEFFNNLQKVAAYIGTADSLHLVNESGESLLVFQSFPGKA